MVFIPNVTHIYEYDSLIQFYPMETLDGVTGGGETQRLRVGEIERGRDREGLVAVISR